MKKYTGRMYVISFVLDDEKKSIVNANPITLNHRNFCAMSLREIISVLFGEVHIFTPEAIQPFILVIPTASADNT